MILLGSTKEEASSEAGAITGSPLPYPIAGRTPPYITGPSQAAPP